MILGVAIYVFNQTNVLCSTDGFTCYAAAEYLGDQHVTGDLRVTSSPNPEVTLTVKTPWANYEQMSASGGYQDDGFGKKEVRRLNCVNVSMNDKKIVLAMIGGAEVYPFVFQE